MSAMNFSSELGLAQQLAREAGKILLEVYATDFAVELKSQQDPVTLADKLANEHIVQGLRAAFPSDGVVAEESVEHGDAMQRERCWYVDPLDGTKEFISKNGEFAVMIGLTLHGESRLGVVYQPVTDKLYYGVVGEGAFLESNGESRALHVSDKSAAKDLRLVVSRSHRPKETESLMQTLGITAEFASGSVGLKIGCIAEQSADLYAHISDKSSAWDACGPEAVVRAAGGRFTDCLGQPFVYGREIPNSRGILACNAATFDQVVPVVADLARAAGFRP